MKAPAGRLLAATIAMVGMVGTTGAAIIVQDDFSYVDGTLAGNGAAASGWNEAWANSFGNDISVSGGVVVSTYSVNGHRVDRQLDATAAAFTDGGAEDDGTTVFIGIDWQFGNVYSGLELTNGGTDFNVQLGTVYGGPELTATNVAGGADSLTFATTASVKRYVIQIDFDDTNGDSYTLYEDGVSLGSRSNVGDLSFDTVGFGNFITGGTLVHGDNLVIATTFNEAALIPEPGSLALLGLGGLVTLLRRRRTG